MSQALSSFVENIARSLQIQDNLQLNVLNNVEMGTDGVKVALDKLKLDNLFSMLYRLENHRPVIRTSHLSISISPGVRLVRASFHVHKHLSPNLSIKLYGNGQLLNNLSMKFLLDIQF